ncbi:hypothetical protein AO943_24030 [Pseudomonas aeruginosa]|nr:hypothetical protein A9P90_29575 [Pseudomonas aeruginosa]KSG10326.1 hypothetical protein AO943_24030 [Pseudomonas aeruginosa]KSO58170.1 hypothetical protein APA99_30525 [Pseudomonas aeruginosa]OES49234.1 hypothetical protein A7R77_31785 [Pseudomonas aeruginosa]OES56730.1 hypothetical protein A7R78_26490 [Pseudomonas aeruginosa]
MAAPVLQVLLLEVIQHLVGGAVVAAVVQRSRKYKLRPRLRVASPEGWEEVAVDKMAVAQVHRVPTHVWE